MDFYLVRHGEAKPGHEDPERPLNERGKAEVEKLAQAAAARRLKVSRILHSDKLRAKETAIILAAALSPRGGLQQVQGLAPEDDPALAKAELEAAAEPVMLVGHLPHLGRLAALLVCGDPDRSVVEFPPAGMACVSRGENGWQMEWTVAPQTL